MSLLTTSRRRRRDERGLVSLLVVILIPVVLFAAGLVLDGGRQLQARRDAHGSAAAAARAAIQLEEDESFANSLDPRRAVERGEAQLASEGVSGTVTVNGADVTVTVAITVDYQILPGSRTVSETATASADQGVNEGSGTLGGG